MDITSLRYFQKIAECGSMTAAARELGVSQPTLTVAVRNLEEELQTTLLLRSRNGVTLTSTGREFLSHAIEIFALLARAVERISGLENADIGSFVIGCHESLGSYFLPAFMAGFLKVAPRIELSLWNGTSADVTEAVVNRRVDFGLVVNPHPHPELVIVDLFKDAVDIFVAASALAQAAAGKAGARPGAINLEAAHAVLRAGPLIYAARVTQCQQLLDRLGEGHLLPTRMLTCGDLELVKSLTLEGLGVALLPRRVAAYGHKGKLVRLHPQLPFIPDTICLLYRGDLHRTHAAMRLKDALLAHGRSLDDDDGSLPP